MSRVIRKPSFPVSLNALAVMSQRQALWPIVEWLRADRAPSELTEEFEEMAVEGDVRLRELNPTQVPTQVPSIDDSSSDPVSWTTVTNAAKELKISERMVRKYLGADEPRLHGEQPGRAWLVCSESVQARKKGNKCQHQSK
jgi:hypothetical protein